MRVLFVEPMLAKEHLAAASAEVNRALPAQFPWAPSPSLLTAGASARAEGHDVSYHALAAEPSSQSSLPVAERVVILAGGARLARAEALRQHLGTGCAVELLDPFGTPAAASSAASILPEYGLAAGQTTAHADVDHALLGSPLHPWVLASAGSPLPAAAAGVIASAGSSSEARAESAVRALAGLPEAHLVLADERVRTDMTRLRFLAELTRSVLRQHRTLLQLHLRAWPADLLAERVLDHLSLLPVSALDLLVGSFRRETLTQQGSSITPSDLSKLAAEVLRSGLAHVSRLSVVLAAPGESANDCVETIKETFRIAGTHGIPRIQFAFYIDGAPPPVAAAEHQRRFLAAHPGWHAVEYRGVQDFLAVLSLAHPQIRASGPLP